MLPIWVPERMGIHTVMPRTLSGAYAARADGAQRALRGFRRQLALSGPASCAVSDRNSLVVRSLDRSSRNFVSIELALRNTGSGAGGLRACLLRPRRRWHSSSNPEALLAELQLPLDLRRENILVSRLVAARTALERRNGAVLDELVRNLPKSSFAEVAHALGGAAYELPPSWDATFAPAHFFDMLRSPSGLPVLERCATKPTVQTIIST